MTANLRLPALALGAVLALAAPASVAQQSTAAARDPTGKADLGVDISKAGDTAATNQEFMKTLSSDQQMKVKQVCLVAPSQPEAHSPPVVAFCKNVRDM